MYELQDEKIASYADDTTSFVIGKSFNEVKINLEKISVKMFNWLSNNQMKGNADKCQFIMNESNTNLSIEIEGNRIHNKKEQKLLGVVFDNFLTFETHINSLCKKAGSKISALSRLTPYMNLQKKRLLMNAFFNSQFSYCPLIWMFHSRKLNNKINFLQERCLRLIYSDKTSTFEDLLKKNKSVCFHHRNLQYLAIELFKVKQELSPTFLKEVFPRNEQEFNGT